MQWEEMTEPQFRMAVKETGLCVVALGVIERHADHLPLGTDFLNAHRISCMAAEREAAVVFPPFYFGQIYEARCFAGTITVRPELLLQLLEGILDDIGRNGFRKIILYNGHGGNSHLLPFAAQCSLRKRKSYSLYLYGGLSEGERKEWNGILETDEHGHACECETSITMANFEHLVDGQALAAAPPAKALGRMKHLPRSYSGIWWYADYPGHYAGDARSASKEKGLRLRRLMIDSFSSYIREVKRDTVVPKLEAEFFDRERELRE